MSVCDSHNLHIRRGYATLKSIPDGRRDPNASRQYNEKGYLKMRKAKDVFMKVDNGRLVIELDIADIIQDPEEVLNYEPSSTGNSYTVARVGNSFAGERLEGLPLSVKLAVYAGKRDIEGIKNLIATRKAAAEAAARQKELQELRELKKLLENVDISELKKTIASKKK